MKDDESFISEVRRVEPNPGSFASSSTQILRDRAISNASSAVVRVIDDSEEMSQRERNQTQIKRVKNEEELEFGDKNSIKDSENSYLENSF